MIALGLTVVHADNQEEANKIARELGKKYPQYNIEVAYQDGKVRLRGNIASEMEKGDITRYVQQMPQVKNVAERFNVVSSLGQPLSEIDPRIVPMPSMLPAQSLPTARVINQGNVLSVAGENEMTKTPAQETPKKTEVAAAPKQTPFTALPVRPLSEQQLASAPVAGKIAANKEQSVVKAEKPVQTPAPAAPVEVKTAAIPVQNPVSSPVKPMEQKPVFAVPAQVQVQAQLPTPKAEPVKVAALPSVKPIQKAAAPILEKPVVKEEPKAAPVVKNTTSEEKAQAFKTPLLDAMKNAPKTAEVKEKSAPAPTLKTPVMITEVALPTMQINSKEAAEIPATSFGVREKKEEPVKVAQIPQIQQMQPIQQVQPMQQIVNTPPAVEHIVNGNGVVVQPQGTVIPSQGAVVNQARPLGVILNHGGQSVNSAAPMPYAAAPAQYSMPQQGAMPAQSYQVQGQYPVASQGYIPSAQGQYNAPQGQAIVPGQNGQPVVPNNAWPTYANYPNYSQVAYPKQYGAGSFPYMGPFYPYPQVPLGWRKVTMEWHDGYWWLDFNDGSFTGPFSPLFRQPTKYR